MIRNNFGARTRMAAAAMALAVVGLTGAATLVVATPAAAIPVGCSDDFYLASANTITQRAADGTTTSTSTGALDPWTIALDPTDGNLYALPNDTATGNHLFRVEADGTSTDLGAVTGVPAGVIYSVGGFDDAGTLWIALSTNLYAIDPATMTATSVVLSAGVLSDFAAIGGALYSQAGSPFAPTFARVDPVTGAVTTVAIAGMSLATSFFTVDGHLYMSQGTSIVEVLDYDTATPTLLTVATGLPATPRDGASCPTGRSPFLNAADDDYSAAPFTPTTGGNAGNVFGNDTRLGAALVATDVTVAILDDGGLAGVAIGADGILTVPTGATIGGYAVVYQICATATPTLCDTAIATLSVVADASPPSGPAAAPTLPATGLDLGGVIAASAILLVFGVIIRWRSKVAARP